MFHDTPRAFVGATTFRVDGMACRRCRDEVAAHIARLPGVASVVVDDTTGTVTVTSDRAVDRIDVAAAVKAAGYDLRP